MGGKSELATATTNQVSQPTQEQLRLAQITQDAGDAEKAAFLKLVRQVMDTTKCTQNVAEIALFDSENDIEAAVLAIIDRNVEPDSWTQSKNRKTKKAEAEEKENFETVRDGPTRRGRGGQDFRGGRRGRSERPGDRPERQNRQDRSERNRPERDGDRQDRTDGFGQDRAERFDRGDRGNRSGRGRGQSSGGSRGGGRGAGGRGGSTRPPRREDKDQNGGEGGFAAPMTMWNNDMQNTKDDHDLNGDNEELNWNAQPLVFTARQTQPQPPAQQPTSYSSVAKTQEPGKPLSFAAAAAMRKKPEPPQQPPPGPIEPPQRSYEKECQPSPSVSPQKPYQQQSSIFGNSGSSYGKDLSFDGPSSDNLNLSRGSANDTGSTLGGLTFTNGQHAQASQGGYQTNAVENLTNQLKNDLGITISAPNTGANSSNVANLLSSFQSASTPDSTKQSQPSVQQGGRFASTPQGQASFNSTVEFVTGGDAVSSVNEYQFGFYADASPTTRENDVEGYKQAGQYLGSANQSIDASPKRLEIDHALSKLNHIDVSPAKSTAASAAPAQQNYVPSQNGHAQQQQQAQQVGQQPTQQGQDPLNKLRAGSGLSYANTTNLSYPGTAQNANKQPHQQQQQQQQQPSQPHHILTISHPDGQQRHGQAQQQPQQVPQQQGYGQQAQQQPQVQQQAQQQAQQQQQLHQQVQQSPAQPQQAQAQQAQQLGQQQAQQQQPQQQPLYQQQPNFAAYSNPYMSSYMNLYSPVTAGMRTDDPGMAAAFLSYPFMNQMDIASLTAMLPPAMASANVSTAQAPPPTMQSNLHQVHQQPQTQQHQRSDQHFDGMPKTYSGQNLGQVTMANTTNLAQQTQQRTTMDSTNNSAVPPPPGFTGPPSNIPAAAATLFQPNLSSLFQVGGNMPGSYAPNLSPFPLMFPGSTPQHKLPNMFPQQPLDDGINDMRMGNKIYGQNQQQQDKYGGNKDRNQGLNMGAQNTPPPQLSGNYAPAYGGAGGMQGFQKKNPYHWNS